MAPAGAKTAGAPGLFERAGFEAFVADLPAASLVRQWGDASVAKVGGKIFATFNPAATGATGTLAFKCSELSFEVLTGLDGVVPAPYLARAKWVAMAPAAPLSADELKAYLGTAHALVAARLTRRVRSELGLDAVSPAARGKL